MSGGETRTTGEREEKWNNERDAGSGGGGRGCVGNGKTDLQTFSKISIMWPRSKKYHGKLNDI